MYREHIHPKKIILSLLTLSIFITIAFLVMKSEPLWIDSNLRAAIYFYRSDFLTAVLIPITYMGNWQTITFLCIIFLLLPGSRMRLGIPLSMAASLSAILQKLLKSLFQRERPDVLLHLIEQGGHSFPSGHSMTGLIFYGFLIFLCRRQVKNRTVSNVITILLSSLIFLIGFSRIYLGVHYPSDVLGGWAIGSFILLILTTAVLALKGKG